MTQMLTTGQIAEKLDIPLWKVQYLLNSRGIKPEQRIGHLRVFLPTIVDRLKAELDAMGPKGFTHNGQD